MSDPIIGIDLGTTNSVVAVADDQGEVRVLGDELGFKIQPSVVAFHPSGSVVVGAQARQRRIIDPQNTVYSAKRLIGRSFHSPEVSAAAERMPYAIAQGENNQPVITTRAGQMAIPEISAILLDHMRSIAQHHLGGDAAPRLDRAVVTVPANFTDAQRAATANAGAIAGLEIPQVLNEPTAAALAYGHKRDLGQIIAVYDFGGGTFDITILKLDHKLYEVLGTAGNSFLGGDDIDERVVDTMVHRFLVDRRVDLRNDLTAMQRLRQVAEQTKVELSRRNRAIVTIDAVAYGPGGRAIDMNMELTQAELISHASAVVDQTFPVCQEAMKLAGLKPREIADVVLVGGTTKMPYVRERVAQFFGKTARTDINPDEAVAVGAALQGLALRRLLGPSKKKARAPSSTLGTARPGVAVTTAVDAPSSITIRGVGDTTTQIELPETTDIVRLGQPLAPANASGDTGTLNLGNDLGGRGLRPALPKGVRAPTQSIVEIDPFGTGTGQLDISALEGESAGQGIDATTGQRTGIIDAGDRNDDSGMFSTRDFSSNAFSTDAFSTNVLPTNDLATAQPREPSGPKNQPTGKSGARPASLGAAIDSVSGEASGEIHLLPNEQTGAVELDPDLFTASNQRLPSVSDPSIELDLHTLESQLDGGASTDFEEQAETNTAIKRPAQSAPGGDSSLDFHLGDLDEPLAPASPGAPEPRSTLAGMPPPARPAPVAPAPGGAPSNPQAAGQPAAAPVHQVPIVLDVIPHSLGIGTVAGYCEELIRRNTRLPTTMKRMFSTSKNLQRTVRIQVCQGESRRLAENVILGDLVLDGLQPRPRGDTQIEVTFQVDASGILHVRAHDTHTGTERDAYLNVVGGQSPEEFQAASSRFQQIRGRN